MSTNNQPAFQTTADNGHSENQDGMTLRDYFAAKASEEDIAKHILKNYQEEYIGETYEGEKIIRKRQAMWTREEARYRYADAMLRARGES